MSDERGPNRHSAPHPEREPDWHGASNEERDPDWFGRTERRQHHGGASGDRGQQYDDWPGESGGHQAPSRDWYGSATQGNAGYDDYGTYQDPRATHNYAPPEPRAHGYDPRYEQAGYGQTGYDQNGYEGQGYDQNGYADQGYDQNGYDPRYDQQGYDPRYEQGGYEQEGYDPRYAGGGYDHTGYQDRAYQGEQGYPDAGYQTAEYQAQQYQSRASFIENGFGEIDAQVRAEAAAARAARSTGESRRVRDDTDPRARRADQTDPRARRADQTDPRARRADQTEARGRRPESTDPRGRRPDMTDAHGRRVEADRNGDGDDPDERKATKTRRRRGPVVLVMVLVMLALVGFGGYWAWGKVSAYFITPDYKGSGTATVVAVKVAKNDTATDIAKTLFDDGVVKSTKAFVNAADADPRSRGIKYGWYKLHKQMSAQSALEALLAVGPDGKPLNAYFNEVTITEGEITVDIYAKLAKATGIPVQQFVDAAKDPTALGVDPAWYTTPRDDGRKSVKSIEGFLFPDTYDFDPDATATQILSQMVGEFNQVIGPQGLNFISVATNKLKIPPYEALIAASIAQVEAANATDMKGVTRILYNRVYKTTDAGHTLGLDSEVIYWERINGLPVKTSATLTTKDIQDPNDKYNTHTVAGFPPGAISNPGKDALTAAINPDPKWAAYCYFQIVGGKMVYAKTYSQFLAQQK